LSARYLAGSGALSFLALSPWGWQLFARSKTNLEGQGAANAEISQQGVV
jgi:hypothetical protein